MSRSCSVVVVSFLCLIGLFLVLFVMVVSATILARGGVENFAFSLPPLFSLGDLITAGGDFHFVVALGRSV